MTSIYIDKDGKNKPEWIQKGKGFLSWTGKHKIYVILIAVIAILLIIQFAFNKPVLQEGPYTLAAGFTQEMYAAGDGNPTASGSNMVVFPYSILLCIDDNSIETVFVSMLEDISVIYIKDSEGNWKSWVGSEPFNFFETIDAYTSYYVYVENDCTLQISCWD